ncbi:multidrug ABC transporter ATP-binding protein [Streptomyces inusitatus]|uniref:Multidrug ABC transporter ATP-binding protein n=1 Tax=Streptomyces inusitatus TaxID=68221 RepID=A0A918Q724_9ACTN|nr:ABC transporter ATP-binding protein [Streptomyces inusitatus]GGZ35110.1 multidrug ABC transporter ATP-binding protein [Streptomyces inusitatus]
MGSAVLEIEDLTRGFGSVLANERISLRVGPGKVVGLLGHNGAGKTTLVSQIVGLLRPDSGSIRVAGVDAVANPATARRCVALQAQAQAPLDGLTPRSAIEIAGRLRGMSRADARAAARTLAEELDLREWLDRRALPEGGGLSGGVRRLTAFAMAAVAPVPLVVLDEPTNDVDAARRRRLWDTVRRLGDDGAGVLLVTHNVVEAERVVDELVVLDHGKVVAAGSPERLRGTADHDLRLELSLYPDGPDPSDPSEPPARAPIPIPIARRVRVGRRVLLTLAAADAEAAVAWAAALRADGRVESYALVPTSLEDVYLAATGAAAIERETTHV